MRARVSCNRSLGNALHPLGSEQKRTAEAIKLSTNEDAGDFYNIRARVSLPACFCLPAYLPPSTLRSYILLALLLLLLLPPPPSPVALLVSRRTHRLFLLRPSDLRNGPATASPNRDRKSCRRKKILI